MQYKDIYFHLPKIVTWLQAATRKTTVEFVIYYNYNYKDTAHDIDYTTINYREKYRSIDILKLYHKYSDAAVYDI